MHPSSTSEVEELFGKMGMKEKPKESEEEKKEKARRYMESKYPGLIIKKK